MTGDIAMLNTIVSQMCSGAICIREDSLCIHKVVTLTAPSEWMYDAVDFHIHPILLKHSTISTEEMKKLMWVNSSGANYRKTCVSYRKDVWERLLSTTIRTQQIRYLNGLLHPSFYDIAV